MTERLATYGTLGPGRSNHHHVADLPGRWLSGTVRGRLLAIGWGAAQGFPGIVLDPDGEVVEVAVLESDALADRWSHLDAFEGASYVRTLTTVQTAEGPLPAYVYALADDTVARSSAT